jgi:hypothetical protein
MSNTSDDEEPEDYEVVEAPVFGPAEQSRVANSNTNETTNSSEDAPTHAMTELLAIPGSRIEKRGGANVGRSRQKKFGSIYARSQEI